MEIIVGISGTRQGMTEQQISTFDIVLNKLRLKHESVELHHGDCVGCDQQIHKHINENQLVTKIVIHPPLNSSLRAYCEQDCVEVELLPEKHYLERNKNIVANSTIMIIVPKEFEETVRSGTWMSYRTAKKLNKKIILIKPDGVMEIWPNIGLMKKISNKLKNK